MMNAVSATRQIAKLLDSARVVEPLAKAKVIVSFVSGDDVLAPVTDEDYKEMLGMAERALGGGPVEYITGKAYFRYAELSVTPDVLIPRKETELVAGRAIELIKKKGYKKALDMCTGSGCIAISLAAETDAVVDAADISEKALKIAKQNALDNDAKISFFISDMFENVSGTYDIIVCNPPYVSEEEYDALPQSVRGFEPSLALLSGDGLEFYRIIAQQAPKVIDPGGALVLEIGAFQAQSVMKLLAENGFKDIKFIKDYQGRDRIVTALKGR